MHGEQYPLRKTLAPPLTMRQPCACRCPSQHQAQLQQIQWYHPPAALYATQRPGTSLAPPLSHASLKCRLILLEPTLVGTSYAVLPTKWFSQVFQASGNQLTGGIDLISYLPVIRDFRVADNMLNGTIPAPKVGAYLLEVISIKDYLRCLLVC